MTEKAFSLHEQCCEGFQESKRKDFKASKGQQDSYIKHYSLKNLEIME